MRKVNLLFVLFLLLVVAAWVLFSDLGGYTSRSALIMARSTSVLSTIDGEVEDVVATVGSKVSTGSLLVTIQNDRIDRSRLTQLRSQRELIKHEIVMTEAQSLEISQIKQRFTDKAAAYQAWMAQDLEMLRKQTFHRLKAAEGLHAAKIAEVKRTDELYQKAHVSAAVLEIAKSEAAIEANRAKALHAELARIDLRVASLKSAGVLHENGSTSYWDEIGDSMAMRLLDNRQQIAALRAKLAQIEDQILVENDRLRKTFAEEHRAQFDGVVNAVLTAKGERVIAGANLLEILDCANPIAIVSVPDHRFGDFYVGQKATIKPLDSKETIIGAVQHISSGALISRDTSIAASPDQKVGGNKVIVAFDNQGRNLAPSQSCDTARRAAVTIETDTFLGTVGDLFRGLIGSIDTADANAGLERSQPF